MLKKLGLEMLKKINRDVKKISLEDNLAARQSLVTLDYIVDFMECIKSHETNKEIDYTSIHREKAEALDLSKYSEKINVKSNYLLNQFF